MSDSNYSSDSDSSVSSFEEVKSVMKGGKSKSKSTKKKTQKKTSKKSSKKKTSKQSSKKKTSKKKTSKKSSKKSKKKSKSSEDKPKRKLNPVIARMNVLRFQHIGVHIGNKGVIKTNPPFKSVIAAARKSLKMKKDDKNTVEVVDKAIELFDASPAKYCD